MIKYLLKRLLLIIPTFLGVTLIVFTITRVLPGGPVERMMNELKTADKGGAKGASSALSEDQIAQNTYYGFDLPIWESYLRWLKKVVTFDLGDSTRYGEPVWDIIISKLPISLFYGLATTILIYHCIPLGISKALRHKTFFDDATSIFVFIAYAIPYYVIGIALIYLFAVKSNT